MRFLFAVLILSLVSVHSYSQSNAIGIKAVVKDAATQDNLPFASVAIRQKKGEQDIVIGAAQTSLEEAFSLRFLLPVLMYCRSLL